MQLGTRWNLGDEPPARLSEELVTAIHTVEAEVGERPWRWTLTWLEGRPVVELDDGTTIRVGADGAVAIQQPGESAVQD